jgi:RNA polymerase sigma-70 factor (ECF subfamily)
MSQESIKSIGENYFNSRSEKDYTILYNRIMPGLRNHIYGFIKDYDTVTDLALITMSKVYNKIHQFNTQYTISTWIYTIGANEARQYIKKKKKKGHVLFSQMEYQNDNGTTSLDRLELRIAVENDYVVNEENELKEAEIQAEYDSTINIINNMKPTYKDILYDRFVNELSYQQLADKHNEPLMTIKNRVTRGQRKIVSEFEKLETV